MLTISTRLLEITPVAVRIVVIRVESYVRIEIITEIENTDKITTEEITAVQIYANNNLDDRKYKRIQTKTPR